MLTENLVSLAKSSVRRLQKNAPIITVVIPVFNKWPVTSRCLESLFLCDQDIDIQLVVVDDASLDETPIRLTRLAGVEVIRNGWNLGFVHSSNRGAALARGRYILFLNNDTELTNGALDALVRRMNSDDRIGIVGSKLIYPDGRLQEAGGIIWSDATGWNYGRYDAPEKPQYNYVRDVDYVSGASLMIRTELFRSLGGFDTRFAPGYYEDADLCFEVRALGRRVVYEPASSVIHHEGLTSGNDGGSGMKRFQAINRPKFQRKWADTLAHDHERPDPSNVARAARMRLGAKRSVLIVDSYVPLYDHDAGSNRIKLLIDGFSAAGLHIVFFPDNLMPTPPYTHELQSAGVEVIYHVAENERSWRELFTDALRTVDVVWISRPDLCRKYLPIVRQRSKLPVLYDTIDLHHLRLRRQAELDDAIDEVTWKGVERLELACAAAADATIVVSDYEAAILRGAGIEQVSIVPTIHDAEPSRRREYAETSGILFIGGYNHPPNVDAVDWLIREIMPMVWEQLPTVVVTLLGSNPPQAVRRLAGELVVVPGFIHDVSEYFQSTRIFVAPLRYGAGLKGKVGHALGYRIPIVTTSVGAEGFNLADGLHAVVANDTATFASAVVQLYQDPDLWTRLASAAADALEPFSSKRVVGGAIELLERVIQSCSEPVVG